MPHPTNLAISNWAQYEQHLNPKCYKTSLIFCRFQSICLFLTVRLIRFWLYFYRFQWRAFIHVSNKPKTFRSFAAFQICWQKNANLCACSEAKRKWKKKTKKTIYEWKCQREKFLHSEQTRKLSEINVNFSGVTQNNWTNEIRRSTLHINWIGFWTI